MNPQECLASLRACLARLPGVGLRSAERMAMALVRDPESSRQLSGILETTCERLCACSLCGSITLRDANPCGLCTSPSRDDAFLCVVEEPGDVAAMERAGGYRGRYHALMGRLSPMNGEGPADLRVQALMKRIDEGHFKEVILALSTDVEGDSTCSYIFELLGKRPVQVTRLAFGLPAGSAIGYSDALTLRRAMKGRQQV